MSCRTTASELIRKAWNRREEAQIAHSSVDWIALRSQIERLNSANVWIVLKSIQQFLCYGRSNQHNIIYPLSRRGDTKRCLCA